MVMAGVMFNARLAISMTPTFYFGARAYYLTHYRWLGGRRYTHAGKAFFGCGFHAAVTDSH
jgi:hypothetical protein